MKRLLFFITFVLFSVGALSEVFAAPARNAQWGGATKRVTTQKTKASSNKRAKTKASKANTQAQSKAQERKEAQQQQFGLMPSELDSTNHNVFHADASAIKGARDTESALRYLPFVTIINTAGFGQQFDLRGQGRLSSNGVKLYINGVPANPTDSYFNPMPIASIIPSLIQEVSVSPGGGSVLYGSGAKGGTINIITSQRGAPILIAGAGYVNTMASTGSSYNAFAMANENFGPHLKANAGLAFQQMGGPREDDSFMQAQGVLGAWYDIGWGQSVSADLDLFYGKDKTTPYMSFIDEQKLMQVVQSIKIQNIGGNTSENYRHDAVSKLPPLSPDKDSRAEKGNGTIESTTIRATGNVALNSQLTDRLNLNVKALYNLFQKKYDKYELELPYFVLGKFDPLTREKGYEWFLPRLNDEQGASKLNNIVLWNQDGGDGHRTDWHYLDQSGTKTKDYKMGGQGEVRWKHDNGEFLFGLSGIYEMSNRTSKSI